MVPRPIKKKPLAPRKPGGRKGGEKRRIEKKPGVHGKEYGYGGSTVDRFTFVDNIVKDGFKKHHVELAVRLLEQQPGKKRVTDMDVITFIENRINKAKK